MTKQTTTVRTADDLGAVIESIGCESEAGFNQIWAVANLAMLALESPQGPMDTERLVPILEAIARIATVTQESIGNLARGVGHFREDQAYLRRLASQEPRRDGREGA
jgi:hypothetical protein